jgi:bacterioferritin-associated ferredoxin
MTTMKRAKTTPTTFRVVLELSDRYRRMCRKLLISAPDPAIWRSHDPRMPEGALRTIICSCNVISDHDVREAVLSADAELCSIAQVYNWLGRLMHCGRCFRSVRRILQERHSSVGRYRGIS